MTLDKYNEICENFADYANKTVTFEAYIPSADDYREAKGRLRGVGAISRHFIIVSGGHSYAIYYKRVSL